MIIRYSFMDENDYLFNKQFLAFLIDRVLYWDRVCVKSQVRERTKSANQW